MVIHYSEYIYAKTKDKLTRCLMLTAKHKQELTAYYECSDGKVNMTDAARFTWSKHFARTSRITGTITKTLNNMTARSK